MTGSVAFDNLDHLIKCLKGFHPSCTVYVVYNTISGSYYEPVKVSYCRDRKMIVLE